MTFDQYSEPLTNRVNSPVHLLFQAVHTGSIVGSKKVNAFARSTQHILLAARSNKLCSIVPPAINVMPAPQRAIFNTYVGN